MPHYAKPRHAATAARTQVHERSLPADTHPNSCARRSVAPAHAHHAECPTTSLREIFVKSLAPSSDIERNPQKFSLRLGLVNFRCVRFPRASPNLASYFVPVLPVMEDKPNQRL